MNKYLILMMISIFLLLFISCPQELTKGTVWEGEIQGNFGTLADDDKNDFEVYFRTDSTVKAYITFSDDEAITLEGDYTLTNNYEFTAELDGEMRTYKFEFDLEGTINYYSGYGTGEYKMKISGGNPEDGTYDDDWDLTKVGS